MNEVDEYKYEIYKRIIEPSTVTIDVHRFMVAEHRALRREDKLITEVVQRTNDDQSWSTQSCNVSTARQVRWKARTIRRVCLLVENLRELIGSGI